MPAQTDLPALPVVGAVGVWFGFPLAEPIIGLLITVAIFGVVWQSAKAVITRSLDGVDPSITAEIRHAAATFANSKMPAIGNGVTSPSGIWATGPSEGCDPAACSAA